MATTYLTRTASANNNSVGKWTFSCWIKRNALQVETNIISFYTDSLFCHYDYLFSYLEQNSDKELFLTHLSLLDVHNITVLLPLRRYSFS